MPRAVRKVTRAGEDEGARVERVDGIWRVRSVEAARQVLRAKDATTQAGFTVEKIPRGAMPNPPILFLDGERHRAQRAKVARFFAPKTVDTKYRGLMESRADALLREVDAAGEFRLDDISLRYSVDIAARVLGLTNSDMDAMARRLERFFDRPTNVGESGRLGRLRHAVSAGLPSALFFWLDVKPAIDARRREPQADVISHLIAEGYDDRAILIECITFGAAGMVTTREFISMAAWHLLETPDLKQRYLDAEEPERYAILQEILRLEPIVGHLFRRAQTDIDVTDGDETHTIRRGDLVDLFIRQVNADPVVVGEDPEALCPGRQMPRGIGAEVESFGDGPHSCPGNSLAIQESDILLRKLLARPLTIVAEPRIGWDEIIAGYSLRGFVLRAGDAA